jgi:hypothetical protein
MTEVMHARSGVIILAAQTNLARQSPEDPMNILVQQSAAALRDEEVRTAARSKMSIALHGVGAECRAGC